MPGRSEYIEAPYTITKFADSTKDAFEFMGYDVRQATDDALAFDAEYWKAKRTTSTKNLVKESEQLVQAYSDWDDFGHNFNGNYNDFRGAEFYITKNTDTSLPFVLTNTISPRNVEGDLSVRWVKSGLKTNTNYTVSFWARGTDATSGGNLTIQSGPNSSSSRSYLTDQNLGALTTTWKRFSYSANTGGNSSLQTTLGGWSTWGSMPLKNLAKRTQEVNYWLSRGITFSYNINTDRPGQGYNDDPDRASFYSDDAVVYQEVGLSNSAGKSYTLSVWIKVIQRTSSTTNKLRINFNGETNQTTTYIDGEIGVWKRYSVTGVIANNIPNTNIHIWGGPGDVADIWGLQFEESSVMTSYQPIEGGFSAPKFWGTVQISGMQLEEGLSVSAYEPVRRWFFKPYSLDLTGQLSNQRMLLYFNVPGGIANYFVSCKANTIGNDYRVGLSTYNNTFYGTGADTSRANLESTSQTGWRATSGMYNWGGDVTNGNSGDSLTILSTGLRVLWGTGSEQLPFGNVYFLLGHRYNDRSEYVYKLDTTVYGIAFRLLDPSDISGTANVTGFGMHQKTPGNGRKKLTSVILREDATGTISMYQHTPVFNQTNKGIAEVEGFFIPTLTPKYLNTVSGADRGNYASWGDRQYYNMPVSRELMKYTSFSKNSDTFSFMQGSADGFVWALNTNSSFFYKYLQADFTNSPMADDDGSLYSRFGVGSYSEDVRGLNWHGHGPIMKNNTYGIGFGNTYRFASPWYGDISQVSRLPEVFGDNFDNDVTFNNIVFQSYAIGEEHSFVSSRGQIKNFFHTPSLRFSGVEGDLLISEDGSKYFNFFKTTGSTNSEKTRLATYVKV